LVDREDPVDGRLGGERLSRMRTTDRFVAEWSGLHPFNMVLLLEPLWWLLLFPVVVGRLHHRGDGRLFFAFADSFRRPGIPGPAGRKSRRIELGVLKEVL
jgi:hypothetical protein